MNRLYFKPAIGVFVIFLLLGFAATEGYCRGMVASGKTAQVIVNMARTIIGDQSTTAVSNANMLSWVNEAAQDIAAGSWCLQSYTSVTVVTDTDQYAITATVGDYFEIEGVTYTGAGSTAFEPVELKRIDPRMIGDMKRESGPPKYFYEWAGYLRLWPVPTSEENSATMRVDYIATAALIDDLTDSIETPGFLDMVYVYYLCENYWLQRGQFNVANTFAIRRANIAGGFKIESLSSGVPVQTGN